MSRSLIHLLLSMMAGCFFLLSQNVYAAKISVWVQPATVGVDEPVTLTISAEDSVEGKPDFSVLEKDFRILHRSNSSSISTSNGTTNIRRVWDVVLMPKKKGRSTIPSISIGDDTTSEITVEVSNKRATVHGNDEDIFIEMVASPDKLYVQGQVLLTQKLYYAVPIDNANLSAPIVKDNAAEVIQLATRSSYQKEVKGRKYTVVERTYALFPTYSGEIHIEPVKFRAQVADKQDLGQLDSFTMFSRRHSVNILSKPLSLTILPQAAGFSGDHWLPASNIALHGKWSAPLSQLKVGEPVSLVLGINSNGLRASALPDIEFDLPEGMKVYPEKIEFSRTKTRKGVVGNSRQRITFVPSKSGAFELPRITIPWWNIHTDQQEEAIFDAVTLQVSGSSLSSFEVQDEQQHSGEGVQHDLEAQKASYPKWLMFLSAALVSFILFVIYKIKKPNDEFRPLSAAEIKQNREQVMGAVKQACKHANPVRTRAALHQWAREIADIHPATLASIGKINPVFTQEIELLSEALYSRKRNKQYSWNGRRLWAAIIKHQEDSATSQEQESLLEDLHPKI